MRAGLVHAHSSERRYIASQLFRINKKGTNNNRRLPEPTLISDVISSITSITAPRIQHSVTHVHAQARQKQERRGRHRDASITGEDGEEKKEKRRRGGQVFGKLTRTRTGTDSSPHTRGHIYP